MIRVFLVLLLFLLFFGFYNKDFSYEGKSEQLDLKEVKLDRVVDGDTVIIFLNGKRERLRLVGLDTPESMDINGRTRECFGKEASLKAKEILSKAEKIYFLPKKNDSRDRYGRLLGYLFIENKNNDLKNFSLKMIEEGYGMEYTYKGENYLFKKDFKEAEKKARINEKGLWNKNKCSY